MATSKKSKVRGMYVCQIYDDFFTKFDALKKTPDSVEGLCFPVSFLSCRLRRISHDENGLVTNVDETLPTKKGYENPVLTDLHRTIPLTNERYIEKIRASAPYLFTDATPYRPSIYSILIKLLPLIRNKNKNGFWTKTLWSVVVKLGFWPLNYYMNMWK